MAAPTVFDLFQIRQHLLFEEGPWLAPSALPSVASDPILAITKRGDHREGPSAVYTILQVRDSVVYRRYLGVDLVPRENPIEPDIEIVKWKLVTTPVPGYGLLGNYYTNITLSGPPLLGRFENVDFVYTSATPPYSGGPYQQFSAQWTGWLRIPESGNYRLRTVSDDGVRLYLDDILYIDNWGTHAPFTDNTPILYFVEGYVKVRLDYNQQFQNGLIQLLWATPATGTTLFDVIPLTYLYTPGFYVD